MSRFVFLLAAMAMAVFPTQGISGQMKFELPFSFMGLATCVALDDHEVKASCDWKRNKEKGYDIQCDFDKKLQSAKDKVTIEMNTKRIDRSAVAQTSSSGQRLSYKFRGIKCTLFAPPSATGFKCRRNSDGFGCKWCGKKNCYQGKAIVSHRAN